MAASDLPDVMGIALASFSNPWSIADFQTELVHPFGCSLVVTEARHVLGFVCGRLVADEAEILTLATATHHRRGGVAARLVARFVQLAAERGAKHVYLEVRQSNLAAQSLYESLGFRRIMVRASYYADNAEDAHVLGRKVDFMPFGA
ncbi:MAG: ribosomal protein S18-alanine N-acetyltransferase [Myxococcales bacterium]|nr:ribosomal protein S18-alanine N-acetyltransferase [Myxococcales bacterium]MCB9709291.1 ribosomal protein S18-alanine N-acetyltransferase [Myxococcales bacterium]